MKNNDLLVIHNILWSHYTGVVLSELNVLVKKQGGKLHVLHIADTQLNRKGIGNVDAKYHQYSYEVLCRGSIEQAGLLKQFIRGLPKIWKSKASYLMVSGYDLPLYIAAIMLARLMGKTLIIVADSTEADRKRLAWKERIKSQLLKKADTVACYGQAHKRYLMKLGVPPEKIFIRVQSTDNLEIRKLFEHQQSAVALANDVRQRRFIFVGRLIPEKNLITLLDAFKLVNSSWQMLIVGDGILRKDLLDYCEQHGIDGVSFHGAAVLSDVVALITASDVLVLASVSETWGLVVNEAMLCEKPVIVSTHCGCASELVVEGKNGFTFDPYSAEELADKMRQFTEGHCDVVEMGKYGYEIVKNFTPEKSASQIFAAIYNH